MYFSNRTKLKLFSLLIILNLILRYQLINHESGLDSFEMHLLANSLSEFGEARWWVHPLSILGMYPNSYASSISFFTSGLSQSAGVDIELSIFIYSLIVGILSIFASFIVAGKFYDDDYFKFATAFVFSISLGVIEYSKWTAQGRSIFLLLFPIFLYLLLQSRNFNWKYIFMSLIIAVFLITSHHLWYYLIPIVFSFLFITSVFWLNNRYYLFDRFSKKSKVLSLFTRSDILFPLLILFAFSMMVAFPFLTHMFMTAGSRWVNLANVFNEYPRYIGFPIFLSIGGYFYLVFKKVKGYEEWILLTIMFCMSIFIFQTMYAKWFVIIFASLLAGIGFMNLRSLMYNGKKIGVVAIVFFLVTSVALVGYINFLNIEEYEYRTINDNTHVTGKWTGDYVDGISIGNARWETWKIAATSGTIFLTGSSSSDQAYGLVDSRDFTLDKRPITSEKYWLDSPYVRVEGSVSDGYWQAILEQYYTSAGYRYIDTFNISYLVEYVPLDGQWNSHHSKGTDRSDFVHDVYDSNICVFDSGMWRIWNLE